MVVGAATVDITPSVGVALAGYRARAGDSDACHDRLEATAFAFADGHSSSVIVSVDLLAVDGGFVEEARDMATAGRGLDPDSILIAATHTHSGPAVGRIAGGEPDEEARATALRGVTAAIERAWDSRQPGWLRVGGAAVEDVGLNRRDPKLPGADQLVAVSLESGDSRLGVLYFYACHPTVLDHDNLSISADFPGVVRAHLRRRGNSSLPVAYINGAAGDISTRFSRRGSSFEELQRLGEIVATSVDTALSSAQPINASPVGFARRTVTLATKTGKTDHLAKAELASAEATVATLRDQGASEGEIRRAIVDVEGILEDLARRKHYLPQVPTEVQAIRIGELMILSVPGELFSGTGRTLAGLGDGAIVVVAGYANDYIGYIPDRAAYEQGSYEVSIAQVDEQAADQIEAAGRMALTTLSD